MGLAKEDVRDDSDVAFQIQQMDRRDGSGVTSGGCEGWMYGRVAKEYVKDD